MVGLFATSVINALLRNEFDEAGIFYKESVNIFEPIGLHKAGLAWAYFGLGETALAQKDAASAIAHLKNALKFFNGYKNRLGISWCIGSLASAVALKNDHDLAAKLWGTADSLWETKGVREAPVLHGLHEEIKTKSRTKLGETKFQALWAENKSIPLEQAVNEALAL